MQKRVFHVLEVRKVIGGHKQALANHACVRSSLRAMSASVHEAEVLLNAAPTAIDPDDQLSRRTCIPDDDPRVEAIVPMMEQDDNGKALVSLKNLTAERYWNARWQREWETKYHDPLVGIKRQEQEYIALGALDIGMERRRAQRVRAALKERESRPEFDPVRRARERAQEFVVRRRRGLAEERCFGGRPRTAFGATNNYVAVVKHHQTDHTKDGGPREGQEAALARGETGHGGRDRTRHKTNSACGNGKGCGVGSGGGVTGDRPPGGDAGAGASKRERRLVRSHTAKPRGAAARGGGSGGTAGRPRSTFATCPRFPEESGCWDENFTVRALSRLAKHDPPVFDYTEGALDSIAKGDAGSSSDSSHERQPIIRIGQSSGRW
ncbi:unnamed protein product [Ectocarpus sp. CCAP 1310/34]|nr:unnamed protein product [Ectocarpus sp. CCAP 1310/34]